MTQRERTCRYMYQKGIFTKTQCELCLYDLRQTCELKKSVEEADQEPIYYHDNPDHEKV